MDARAKAGVAGQDYSIKSGGDGTWLFVTSALSPPKTVIPGIALLRLGRYEDALATLSRGDVPLITHVGGLLMSPWNVPALMTLGNNNAGWFSGGKEFFVPGGLDPFYDPIDLLARTICHHHLGHPKEALACLQQARGIIAKIGNSADAVQFLADAVQFLHEAEALIGGKLRP
jgi:hypothetical protein